MPDKITLDKSSSNKDAIKEYNAENDTTIEIHQIKYLNDIIEQGHRSIKRITRLMLGFKDFYSATVTLRGIELVRMIRKGQMKNQNDAQNPAEIFYYLAA